MIYIFDPESRLYVIVFSVYYFVNIKLIEIV